MNEQEQELQEVPREQPAEAQPEAEQPAAQEAEAPSPELQAAKAKADEYLAMAQRVQADFENFRRRNESVRADAYEEGRRSAAGAMLPVLDNLERALSAAGGEETPLKSGLEMTLKQMRDAYAKMEVTPIDRLGERFDPALENAVMQGSPEEGEPGTVCQVLQKGYMMGKQVLRHAMVKVVPE